LLTDGATDLQSSNTTEDLTACSCFGCQLNRSIFQFGNYQIDFSKHFVFFLPELLQLFFQLFAVGRICFNSKLLGYEKIAAISVTNLHHFMSGSQVINIFY
jgi:hypothetical protein